MQKSKFPVVPVVLGTLFLSVGSIFAFGNVSFETELSKEVTRDTFSVKEVTTDVTELKIIKQTPRHVEVEVEYSFQGTFGPGVIQVVPISERNPNREYHRIFGLDDEVQVIHGKRKVRVLAKREQDVSTAHSTTGFEVQLLRSPGDKPFFRKEFQQAVSWPAYNPGNDPYFLNRERKVLYGLAVDNLNKGSLSNAKYFLDRIIVATPDYAPAHYQMGNLYFKSNRPLEEKLNEAAGSAKTATALDPEFVDAYILLGHIYLHQNKFEKSQQQFETARSKGTKNLWLYSRWGEMHNAKHEPEKAAEKFEKVVAQSLSDKKNNEAMEFAYGALLGIYLDQGNWKDSERLYKARINKFPKNPCYKAKYANYLIDHVKELDKAELMATDAKNAGCEDVQFSTQVLAKVLYLRWSKMEPTSKDALIAFSRAKAIAPVDSRLLISLATSGNLNKVLKALIKNGFDINKEDDRGRAPIFLAIRDRNISAVENLIAVGADVNIITTNYIGSWTPLMVATFLDEEKLVKLLLKNGADPNIVNDEGVKATDIAKQRGNTQIFQLLSAYNV